ISTIAPSPSPAPSSHSDERTNGKYQDIILVGRAACSHLPLAPFHLLSTMLYPLSSIMKPALSTTILSVRKADQVALGGDGQVTRRLEALLAVVDKQASLMVSGAGDCIQPTDGIIGIGSGGPYALAAAKALLEHSNLSAKEITEAALKIAGEICIYTNKNIK